METMMDDQPLLSSEDPSSLAMTHMQKLHQQMIDCLAVLSHEFRTPLTIINTATSLLLRNPTLSSEERGEMLQMIQQASQRLSTLTDRTLELARLEAETCQIEYRVVDILSILRDVLSHAQQAVAPSLRDCFTFQLQCQDEMGNSTSEAQEIIGDTRYVYQVFAYLLENAIRFSPNGGAILIAVRPALPEREVSPCEMPLNSAAFLEISVSDTGVGMERQHLEHIFEPFYQVETGLTREVSGLGIGLTICSHLIALHRGRIWATSREGEGSTFHVWLPRTVIWS